MSQQPKQPFYSEDDLQAMEDNEAILKAQIAQLEGLKRISEAKRNFQHQREQQEFMDEIASASALDPPLSPAHSVKSQVSAISARPRSSPFLSRARSSASAPPGYATTLIHRPPVTSTLQPRPATEIAPSSIIVTVSRICRFPIILL